MDTAALILMLSGILGLGLSRRDNKWHRNDQAVELEVVIATITQALQSLQTAAEPTEPAPGELTTDEMKEKITKLEDELATMRTEKADQEKEEEEEAEKTDRAKLDAIAKRMRFDTRAWTAATTADDRRLALVVAAKLMYWLVKGRLQEN